MSSLNKKYLLLCIACSLVVMFTNAQPPTFVWAKSMGGNADDIGYSIAVDSSGSIYIIGKFQGTSDFDPGVGVFNLTSYGMSDDIYISKLDSSGNFKWAKQFGGTSNDEGYSIALDLSGNVYATGFFTGAANFDPGNATYSFTAYAGTPDIFILKLDSAGNFKWAKQMGGTSYDFGRSIAIDTLSNVYVTGTFQGTSDFDPGAGVSMMLSAGQEDVFISKLDSAGNFKWVKQFGGTLSDKATSIFTDASGNVYSTGCFKGTADFDPGSGTFNLTSTNSTSFNAFISKLDSLGNFKWAKQLNGASNVVGNSIIIDTFSNVYITGDFVGTADFDPGIGTFNLTSTNSTSYNAFISKLDSLGNFKWAKNFGGSFSGGNSITLDKFCNIYTTGIFQGTADFDPGVGAFNLTSYGAEMFISKLDSAGNFLWAKNIVGALQDYGYSIVIDTRGNIYTTGIYYISADFDPGAGTFKLSSSGYNDSDIIVHKMSQTIWNTYLPITNSPVVYCQNDATTPLTATGISLNWYMSISGGNALSSTPTPVTTAVGITNYYVSQTINGYEGPRANIVVIVKALPNSPVVTSPIKPCLNDTPPALTASGNTLKWYTMAIGGIGSTTAPVLSTANIDTTDYYVSQTLGGCEGPRSLITVIVKPVPTIPVVTSPITYCQNELAIPVTAAGIALFWGPALSVIAPTPSTSITGTTNYYVRNVINGCWSAQAFISVIVNPSPAAVISPGSALAICNSGGSVALTSSIGTSYSWLDGTTLVGIDQIYHSTAPGSYKVVVTNASGCKDTSTATLVIQDTQNCYDCANVLNGSATHDNCGICTGGNTGLTACVTTETMNSIYNKENIVAFPQPFDKSMMIKLKNGRNIQSVLIINSIGIIVGTLSDLNVNQTEIGEPLSSGIYTLIIQSEKEIYIAKITKQSN